VSPATGRRASPAPEHARFLFLLLFFLVLVVGPLWALALTRGPHEPFCVFLLVLALSGALDACVREVGLHAASERSWPEGWRAVVTRGRPDSPYREGEQVEWARVVPAGIPRAVSVCLIPLVVLWHVWGVGGALDLLDLLLGAPASRGELAVPIWPLSLLHLLVVGGAMVAAYRRQRGLFLLSWAVGIGIDAVPACGALLSSGHPSYDLHLAHASLAAQGALGLGFAWSLWRRRGLVAAPP
jgi:hypothetical protein